MRFEPMGHTTNPDIRIARSVVDYIFRWMGIRFLAGYQEQHEPPMARFVSLLVLVAILVIISIIFFQVMAGFFVPLFLAALLGVIVQPLYRWILARCRGYQYVAAGITTTVVALIVLLPIGLIVTVATLEALSLVDELQVANFRDDLTRLRNDFGLQIPCEHDVRHIEATMPPGRAFGQQPDEAARRYHPRWQDSCYGIRRRNGRGEP